MAKASLSISIYGDYNPKAIAKCEADLRRMSLAAAREAQGIGSGFISAGDKVMALGNSMQYVGDKIQAAGKKITTLTAPLAVVGAAAVKLASDYEQSVAKVYTIMDKSAVSTEKMAKDILDLSTATGKSATELADATYQALSASVATDKVAGFVADAVKLSKAGFTETATAVDTLTTVINAYGYSADDAEMITNRLVQTQNKGKTTVNELASSMGNVIPTASAYNVSLDNLCSAYVIMTKQGINTANATTAINGMLTELASEGSTVADILKNQTGKSFGQLMKDGMSLGDVIQLLSESVNGDSEAFANLWGNVRASKGALAIANAGASQFTQAMDDMADSAGLVDQALDDLAMPTDKAGKALNALKNTGIELGQEIIGAAAPSIEKLAQAAQGLYKWFGDLDEGTKQNIVRFGALAVAAGPVLTVVGKLTSGVGGLVTGFGKTLQSAGALSHELSLVRAATTAAQGPTMSFGQAVSTLGEKHVPGLTRAMNTLKPAIIGTLGAAGVGIAIAGIGLLVGELAKWHDHTVKVDKATRGLEQAMGAADAAYGKQASAVSNAASSLGDYRAKAEDALEAQANLADTMTEKWSEVGSNTALIDHYASVIEELGEKGSLTAEEQVRLAQAVEEFNKMTGSGIEVIDSQTGALNTSKDAVLGLAEAYREEARAAAAKEMLVDINKQVLQDEIALKQAQEELSRAEQEYQYQLENFPDSAASYGAAVTAAGQKVDEMSRALDSAKQSEQDLVDIIAASPSSFKTLEDALASCGLSIADLGDVSEEELAELQASFDGSLSSVVKACQKQGREIPEALSAGMKAKTSAAEKQANKLALTVQNKLDKMPDTFKSIGVGSVADMATGMLSKLASVGSAATNLSNTAKNNVSGLPASYSTTGSTSGSNMASGLSSMLGAIGSAATSICSTAKNSVSDLPASYRTTGSTSGSNMASGLSSQSGGVLSAATTLLNSAKSGISGAPAAYGSTGTSSGNSFASGIGSVSAYGQGRQLANTGRDGMGSVGSWDVGANFSNGFADGILAAAANVQARAWSLANSALNSMKRALGIASPSKEAMAIGEYFVQGAVVGMKKMESALNAETNLLSDIMTLEPTASGTFALPTQGAGLSTQSAAALGTVMYITVTVNASNANEGRAIGVSLADALYDEWSRKEATRL